MNRQKINKRVNSLTSDSVCNHLSSLHRDELEHCTIMSLSCYHMQELHRIKAWWYTENKVVQLQGSASRNYCSSAFFITKLLTFTLI